MVQVFPGDLLLEEAPGHPEVGKSAMKRVLRLPCSSWQEERCQCSGADACKDAS